MPHQNLTPVGQQERINTIDIIRGFALLGIIIVNFTVDMHFNPGPVGLVLLTSLLIGISVFF